MARRTFHHGSLPRDVMAAARKQLEQHGAAALSLRGVAKATGVFPTAISHHFGDREGLLAALAEAGFAELGEAFDATGAARATPRPAQRPTPRASLRAILAAYVAFARAHPATFQLMFSPWSMFERRHPSLEAAGNATYAALLAAVARWIDTAGASRDPDAVATGIWCTGHGLATLAIEDGRGTRAGRFDVDAILDLALRPL